MQIAIIGAGFDPSEADRLRRALATFKKHGNVSAFRTRFLRGMARNGYARDFAEREVFPRAAAMDKSGAGGVDMPAWASEDGSGPKIIRKGKPSAAKTEEAPAEESAEAPEAPAPEPAAVEDEPPCSVACPANICVQGYASRVAAGRYADALYGRLGIGYRVAIPDQPARIRIVQHRGIRGAIHRDRAGVVNGIIVSAGADPRGSCFGGHRTAAARPAKSRTGAAGG